MGRKKRRALDLRPFCYYCDRSFDNEKVLIQHQKVKHFKCSECNRKLDTATGLVVHMIQVHKQATSKVPKSIPGRDNPDIVIHGMEGVPQDIVAEKQNLMLEGRSSAKHLKATHTQVGLSLVSHQFKTNTKTMLAIMHVLETAQQQKESAAKAALAPPFAQEGMTGQPWQTNVSVYGQVWNNNPTVPPPGTVQAPPIVSKALQQPMAFEH
eukprot:GHVP01047712.1.p1 GENE.GHVP01047712.1~~GHVP01047712.1.p1  ORF type:complete len:222 (+),score=38.12 GHVP01047712.1:38-667(+)